MEMREVKDLIHQSVAKVKKVVTDFMRDSTARFERLEGEMVRRSEYDALKEHALGQEEKLARLHATVKRLVDASNNVTLLVKCVEDFLDRTHGDDWDAGVRAKAERKAALLRRRGELVREVQVGIEHDVRRNEVAAILWEGARELGCEAADLPFVVSLYLQSGDVDRALDVVEEVHSEGIELPPEVAGVVQKLVDRCTEIARERGKLDDSEARKQVVLGPDGRPADAEREVLGPDGLPVR